MTRSTQIQRACRFLANGRFSPAAKLEWLLAYRDDAAIWSLCDSVGNAAEKKLFDATQTTASEDNHIGSSFVRGSYDGVRIITNDSFACYRFGLKAAATIASTFDSDQLRTKPDRYTPFA